MLRIAEYNKITGEKVDLKELEKFGFEPMEKNYRGHKYIWKRKPNYYYEKENYYYCIYINKNNYIRIIVNDGITIAGQLQDKLYELISAGIVERI